MSGCQFCHQIPHAKACQFHGVYQAAQYVKAKAAVIAGEMDQAGINELKKGGFINAGQAIQLHRLFKGLWKVQSLGPGTMNKLVKIKGGLALAR